MVAVILTPSSITDEVDTEAAEAAVEITRVVAEVDTAKMALAVI